MQRESNSNISLKNGVQLFSDMMLMKFKPKNCEGLKQYIQLQQGKKQFLKQNQVAQLNDQTKFKLMEKLNHITFLELASKQAIIIGNCNQIDMINLDGLSHNFVDTYHYWSLNISKSILNIKVNMKKQILLILTNKAILLYNYNSLKRQKAEPKYFNTIQIKNQVKFIQFPSSDLISIFYQEYMEFYSINDANIITKKLQKKYGLDSKFKLFAVPQAIDQTINVIFEQKNEHVNTFGLWCIQVNLLTQNVKLNSPYKIYDIMNGLKKILIIQNYSKDIVFLNLGRQILVAKKGYIVDSVSINLQNDDAFLKYLPNKQILVHIERSSMELYSFKINMNVVPHRIQLKSIDSIEIKNKSNHLKLLSLLPIFQQNYALFYEDRMNKITTNGEIFYSFILTFSVDHTTKVNKILETSKLISEIPDDQLENKCDILRKIGLKDEEIYLEIWKRTTKSSIKDFQIILATRDYKTIKNEIQAKMKKQSMSFKQVYKIQQSCLQILKSKTATEYNQQTLKDFLTCNLFFRKLSLFRELYILRNKHLPEHDKIFYINIQDYYNLKNIELKQLVLIRVNNYLLGQTDNIHEIRVVLNHFRFVYRYIYKSLLEEIVKNSKLEVKKVLEAIPELLPIDIEQIDKIENTQTILYAGVWQPITQDQWDKSLLLGHVLNLFNKDHISQFTESLWFRRNWLTVHDLIAKTNTKIEKNNQEQNSVEIFYFFIDKLFENIKERSILQELIQFIQKNYDQFPAHLKDKVCLYSKLFEYYKNNYQFAKCPKFTFEEFLKLRDKNLFKYFFDFQKMKKNCLLKQIKPIYENDSQHGFDIFNMSLFNYFKSDISQISNLKYLLNRINNQKKQFHAAHQKMYEVLIKAMQIKLKIGSGHDIPVDQVLIYIQNIPIGRQNIQMIKQLEIIQKISEESEIFKKMRINMTIREIIDNFESVIQKLVNYQIKSNQILQIDNKSLVISKTYRILAEIQSIKEKIYGTNYNELPLFIYLTKLLEYQSKIDLTHDILNDQYLNNYFYIDLKIIESLVYYMYRWKFSQNSSFIDNKSYIYHLCQLLPNDNNLRLYIQHEVKYALLLSTPLEKVTFPLTTQSAFPRIIDLQQIIKFIDNEHLVKIKIEEVIQVMKRLQQLSVCLNRQESKFSANSKTSLLSEKIEQSAIYQSFIKIFITRSLMKEVIPLIKQSMELTNKINTTIILIMIYYLIPQLNEESRVTIVKISLYLYKEPLKLLNVIEKLLNFKFTGLEAIQYLHDQLKSIKSNHSKHDNYTENNFIFNVYFTHLLENNKQNKNILIQNILSKLKQKKQQFSHDFILDFIFIILCYQPYNIAIFLKYAQNNKNKVIRNFVSYLIQQDIFDNLNVLQLFKRVFYLLLRSYKQNIDIYKLVLQYGNRDIGDEFAINSYQDLNDYQKNIEKCVTTFEKKKNKVIALERSMTLKKKSLSNKSQSIKYTQHAEDHKGKQYVFSDSDDDLEHNQQDLVKYNAGQTKKKSKIKFDPAIERKGFIKQDHYQNIEIRKKQPKVIENAASQQQCFPEQLQQDEQFNIQPPKTNSKIKKYSSMNVIVNDIIDNAPQKNPKVLLTINVPNNIPRVGNETKFSPKSSPIEPMSGKSIKSSKSLTFQQQVKHRQQIQPNKLDQYTKQLMQEQQQLEQPILLVQNKLSQKQKMQTSDGFDSNLNILLKKIYKTYSQKLENQPYSLKFLSAEKTKLCNKFPENLNKLIKIVYLKPQKSVEIALKLIIQIAKKYPQSQINIKYAEIYQKIAKFENKYGLELPLTKILTFEGLFLKTSTPQQLFTFLKKGIIEVCDDENIFKISKLVSIGFKKNTIQQDITLLYLHKLVEQLDSQQESQQGYGIEKMKGLLQKMQVKVLIQKAQSIVDQCSHFELRRKLVQVITDMIRIKGNGKDARQLIAKLK